MTLFLSQHGACFGKAEDPDQSLTDQGIATVARIASVAADYGVRVLTIEHSVKKRARQTAEIFATALEPAQGMVETAGLKPMDDVTAVARRIRSRNDLMLVGHLPFMERLVSHLVCGNPDNIVFRFQNGGIVALDQGPNTDAWFIKWALMPDIR